MSSQIHLSEIENAINYWRARHPSDSKTMSLCWQARALADEYAKLIYFKNLVIQLNELSPKAKDAWYEYLNQQNQQSQQAA